MTTSYKFGNGRLLLGNGPLNVTGQVRACAVEPSESVSTIEAIPLLDNTEIAKEEQAEYSFVLTATLLQDLSAAGVIEWSYDHAGQAQDFVFIPDLPTDRGFQGTCYPVPIKVGGEVTKPRNRPQSDISWRIQGTPLFGDYNAVDDDVEDEV